MTWSCIAVIIIIIIIIIAVSWNDSFYTFVRFLMHIIKHNIYIYIYIRFFFLWRCGPTRAMASSFTRFLNHRQRSTAVGRTSSGGMIGPSQRPLPDNTHNRQTFMPSARFEPADNTQHSQQTDFHDPGGIRTRNPNNRAAADPRVRSRGHWDRHA